MKTIITSTGTFVSPKDYLISPLCFKHCALAICLPMLFAGCIKQQPEAVVTPIPVKTFQLGTAAIAATELFPVTLVRDRESNVSFRVGGIIQAMGVRAGQMVQAGQVLATLKQTPYVSNRMRAEADLNKLLNASRRNQELLKAGAISNSTKEDTEDTLNAAKATLNAAQYDEESATITAPFAGIILTRDAEIGETVGSGQRIIRIADINSTVIAKAAVPTQVARQLRVGAKAQIRINGSESFLPATIRLIGALSDPKTASVTVDLQVQQASAIASGTLGSVEFIQKLTTKMSEDILLPPEALLESKDGTGYVYVLDAQNATARRTPIKVLGFEGELIRIAGLNKGVKVLTTGAGFVSDGQKVQEIRQ
jgi:multidrug efflux system membrane fusion protein